MRKKMTLGHELRALNGKEMTMQEGPVWIHLHLNKTMQEGLDIINHQKSQTNAQSKIKLAITSIPRKIKEDGEIYPNTRFHVKVMR